MGQHRWQIIVEVIQIQVAVCIYQSQSLFQPCNSQAVLKDVLHA